MTTLTQAQERDIIDALNDLYQGCGADLGWAERSPEDDEFVDVLSDLYAQQRGTADVWFTLPRAEKRRLCLKVGP